MIEIERIMLYAKLTTVIKTVRLRYAILWMLLLAPEAFSAIGLAFSTLFLANLGLIAAYRLSGLLSLGLIGMSR
jgi:hypothetical protein